MAKRSLKKKSTAKKKKLRIASAGGFSLVHDGRAKFDLSPLVPYIQEIADVWYWDDVDEERRALARLLNPSASTSQKKHTAVVIEALDEWGFYDEAKALAAQAGPPKTSKKKKSKKKGPTKYGLGAAAEELCASVVEAIADAADELSGPVSVVAFFLHQTAITPWDVYVFTGKPDLSFGLDDSHELEVSAEHGQSAIPATVDDEDPLLDAFCAEHELDRDLFSWGSSGLPPGALYVAELGRALSTIVPALEKAGVPARSGAKAVVYDDDGEIFRAMTKAAAKKRTEAALKKAGLRGKTKQAFLALCD